MRKTTLGLGALLLGLLIGCSAPQTADEVAAARGWNPPSAVESQGPLDAHPNHYDCAEILTTNRCAFTLSITNRGDEEIRLMGYTTNFSSQRRLQWVHASTGAVQELPYSLAPLELLRLDCELGREANENVGGYISISYEYQGEDLRLTVPLGTLDE